MLITESEHSTLEAAPAGICTTAVLWIDWYAYHVSRFQALCDHPRLKGSVAGIEMVGGTGVHAGLKFREEIPAELPVTTLFPEGDWASISPWKIASAIWHLLNRLNPSTVLVPGYYNIPALATAVWARLKGRRSVLMAESTEADHRRVWWKELLKKALVRSLFSSVICGGRAHRRYLERLGFQSDRIARFYDVVDNKFFWNRAQTERVRHRAHELGLHERYFLFVGRLAEEKNVTGLLEAYQHYREAGGSWSLVIVGGGPQAGMLRERAARSPFAGDIRFEGLKTSQELSPYYAFAGCFVLPSTREPWGLVVNEAMAAGLPVIVSAACGCAEDLVVNGENGYLFEPHSACQLIDSLHTVSALSPAEWKAMGENSARMIAQYSPEAWAEEVARITGV